MKPCKKLPKNKTKGSNYANIASIEHLKDNNAALVADGSEKLPDLLEKFISEERLRTEFAKNGIACARKFHNKSTQSDILKNVLEKTYLDKE